jgi:hypothetical protein
MGKLSKKITADQAPKGAKRKLIGTIVEYISIVDAGANLREFVAKAATSPEHENMVKFEKQVKIVKLDEALKRVMGVVYTPDETDAHGDYMDKATVEAMAADFLRGGRTNNVDKQHSFIPGEGYVMESYLIKDGGDPEFPEEKSGTWVVTIQVTSESTWNKIKDGELKGLSLAGYASIEDVVPLEEDKVDKAEEPAWDLDGATRRLEMRATKEGVIDFVKYGEGFASVDPEEHLDSIKAYQYPHHDVVNGELVVNLRGVRDSVQRVVADMIGERLIEDQSDEALGHLDLHLTKVGESFIDVPTGELVPKSLRTLLEKFSLPVIKLPKGITKAEAISVMEDQTRCKAMQEVIKQAGTMYDFEASLKLNYAFVLGYTDLIFLLWYILDNIFYSRELTLTEKQKAITTSVTAFLNVLQALLVQAYSLTLSKDGENLKSLIEVTPTMLEKDGKITLSKEELQEKLDAACAKAVEEVLKAKQTPDVTPKEPLAGGPSENVTKEISGLSEQLVKLTETVIKLSSDITGVVDRVKVVEEARGISKSGDPDNPGDTDEVPYEEVGVGKSLNTVLKKGKR